MGAFTQLLEERLYPELDKKQTKMPVVPEGAKRSTLNLQAVHGGEEESYDGMPSPCVPDSCRMVLDRRFLIEESLEEVKPKYTNSWKNWSAPVLDSAIRSVTSWNSIQP